MNTRDLQSDLYKLRNVLEESHVLSSELKDRVKGYVDGVQGRVDRLNALYQKKEVSEQTIRGYKEKLERLQKDYGNHKLASSFLSSLISVVSEKNIERVEQLVNSALKTVFVDSSVSFVIESSVLRNQQTYQFKFIRNGDKEQSGLLDSQGGGLIAFVAFILKVMFNQLSGSFPFVVLDESLSFVSAEYRESVAGFIRELCNQLGVTVLMVSHDRVFLEAADRRYRLTRVGTGSEGYTRVEEVR